MPDPLEENTYILNPEDTAEMARLSLQDRLITKGMGGLFYEHAYRLPPGTRRILDVGCGPGDWAISVATKFPEVEVTGFDISRTMLSYAQSRIKESGIQNVTFVRGNALHPLPFADGSFDLVNARFMSSFILRDKWPVVLSELYRLTTPGGILQLTESDNGGATTSVALRTMFDLIYKLMYQIGYGFSPDGVDLGITPMLPALLRDVGCPYVYLRPHVLNFSYETTLHAIQLQNYAAALKGFLPLFIRAGLITEQGFYALREAMFDEMRSENFRGVWMLLTAWGEKPY